MRKSLKTYRSGLRATTALTAVIAGAAVLESAPAFAAVFNVNSEGQLAAAINSANINGQIDTIIVNGSIILVSPLPVLGDTNDDNLTVNLNGNTISGSSATPVFSANAGSAQIENGTISFGTSGGSIDTNVGATLTLSGQFSGASGTSFVKQGGGTLALTGNNSGFLGATIIENGVLQVSQDNNLGLSAGDLGIGNGTLRTTGTFTSARNVDLTGAAGIDVQTATQLTLSGGITGVGSLTKSGAGTLVLTGSNSYIGGTVMTAGTLIGDTTSLQGSILNNASVVFDQSGAGTYAGAMSGIGTLTKQGVGTLVLTGVNTYSNGTSLLGGVLQISQDRNLGAASGGLVIGNGTLKTTSTFTSARGVSLVGTAGIDVVAGTQLDLSGIIINTGSLTKTGAGTLRLTGANLYTGGTTVSAGTLIGDATSLQGDIINNASVVFDQSVLGTYGGIMSGTGALTKKGAGTLVLSGNNTFSGGLVITDGVIEASSNANLGDPGSAVTLVSATSDGNATLRTTGTFSSARNFAFDNFGGRIDTNAGTTLSLSGQLSGGGGANFIKQGAGTLVLTGNSTGFLGTTKVTQGTLRIEGGGDLGSASSAAGYISGTGGQTANVVVTGAGSTWTSGGQIRVGDTGSGTLLIEAGGKVTSANSGIIGASGGTTGAVTITGSNSEWSSAGSTLYVGGFGTGQLTVANGGTMKVGGGAGKIEVGYLANSPGGSVNIGAAQGSAAAAAGTVQASEIALTAGAGKVVFNHTEASYVFTPKISGAGSVSQLAGTTVLAGVNSYAGGTSLFGGVLQVSQDNNLGAASGGLTIGNGTLRTTGTFTSARGVTLVGAAGIDVASGTQLDLSGIIINTGSLTKTGAGTLRLTGANTYTGGTVVSAGTLIGNATSLQGDILNNASVVFDQSGAGTYGGVMSGTGEFTKQGTGTLVLSGNNTFSGGLVITDGVIEASSNANLGDPGSAVTLVSATSDGNATLRTTGTFSSARNFVFDNFGGRVDTNAGTTLTLSGQFSGGGGANFIKQGTGTLVLTGNSTGFLGTTKVTQGTLRIESGGDLGSASSGAGYVSGTGGETAHVVVTGAGSTWTSGGQIRVGDAGSGTLRIEAGGKVTSANDGIIGTSGGVSGAVAITGAGSEWASAGSTLYVGGFGTGALTVADGGSMKVGGGTGKIQVGYLAGSVGGTVNIGAVEGDAAAAAGTLQASEIVLTASAGRMVFNHIDTGYAFSQKISGAGGVKQLAGTTVLSGANTYAGGTTITGGVLSVSSDGNLGASAGAVSIGAGTLRATQGFVSGRAVTLAGAGTIEAQVDELELTGNLTGAGSLTKTGAGDLRLSGFSSYGGGTTVSAGKLIGDTDSLQGAILNNAALDFEQTFDGTYAGVLSGTGTIAKHGTTSTLVFTGISSGFTGSMTVEEGTLRVNGTLGGTMTVKSNATLGGTGTVGKTMIEAGGVHAPGNSIGTQTVDGDYTNKGTLLIEATSTPTPAADKVVVHGAVDIDGAALELDLSPTSPGAWQAITGPLVIIDNDGSDAVTGAFGSIVDNLVFLDPTVRYNGGSGNDVTLELLRNDISFSDVAQTRNQRATAGAIGTLDNVSVVWRALALAPGAEAARAMLDELSGEIHASIAGMLNQDSRFWRNAANDRLRAAFNGVAASNQPVMGFGALGLENTSADTRGLALWTHGFGTWSTTDSDGNAAEFKRNAGGMLAGADMPVGDAVRLGILGGYTHSSFDADDRSSSGNADSYQIGVYGGARIDAVGFRAGVAYAWHDVETTRHALGDKLEADYDAGTVQVFGETGYTIDLGQVRFEPFANAAFVSTRIDDFSEKGGPAALDSDTETNDDIFTVLGLRTALALDLGDMPAELRATVGWRHAYGDVTPDATFAFEGSESFVIAGAPVARDAAVIEVGFDLHLTNDATLGLAYSGEISDDAEDHGVNATLGLEF